MTGRIIKDILRWADMLYNRLYDYQHSHNHPKVRPMYCGFAFLTRLPRLWPTLFLTLI